MKILPVLYFKEDLKKVLLVMELIIIKSYMYILTYLHILAEILAIFLGSHPYIQSTM